MNKLKDLQNKIDRKRVEIAKGVKLLYALKGHLSKEKYKKLDSQLGALEDQLDTLQDILSYWDDFSFFAKRLDALMKGMK